MDALRDMVRALSNALGMEPGEWEQMGRLMAAAIACGLVGWEREASGKAAGLRTHMIVGIGAALIVMVADRIVLRSTHLEEIVQLDPTRVVEAVGAGVGFIGAGIIFRARDRERVHGLTTAAAIWTTAIIGMTFGLGDYSLGIFATLLVWSVLWAINRVESRFFPKK